MALANRRKWIAVKLEGTKGTIATVAAADAKILAYDVDIQPSVEFEQREAAGFGGGTASAVPGTHLGRATFSVMVRGSGTTDTLPAWHTCLLACGFKVDDGDATKLIRQNSIATQKTVTIGVWMDGKRKSLHGAVGNVTFSGTVGQMVRAQFEFVGIYNVATDETRPAEIAHEATIPPRFASSVFSFGAYVPAISQFEINLNNQTEVIPGHTTASGLAYGFVTMGIPTLSCDPLQTLVATEDIEGKWIAGTEVVFAMELGSAANNEFEIDGPKLQYINPQAGDRNGLSIYQLEAQFNSSITNGDGEDDISFSFPSTT